MALYGSVSAKALEKWVAQLTRRSSVLLASRWQSALLRVCQSSEFLPSGKSQAWGVRVSKLAETSVTVV